MNPIPEPTSQAVTDAQQELNRLGGQVEAMQALLVRLLQDVVVAERRLERSDVARLVEVNEQLVVAAITSRSEAAGAAQALQEATQSITLDPLTRLPNRAVLLDRLEQAIASARRHGSCFALLFLDLDRFKLLNDSHGHAFGDAVLCHVAQRLVASVREVDTVSRHGGDEFLVLLPDMAQAADALPVAAKLIAAIGAPFDLEGSVVQIGASVGIAVYPDDGDNARSLVASADAAMYRTKQQRSGGAAFHGPAPQPARAGLAVADAEHRLAMLREANERLVLAALGAQELQSAAELARQRQAAFVTAVAQELSNPMAPIRIAAAMLGRGLADEPLLPRVQQMVSQHVTRMTALLGHVAGAAQPDGLALQPQLVEMGALIDAAAAACLPLMEARGQQFECRRPPGPLLVSGDAAGLEQVLSNLLDNASKHTHDGGHIVLGAGVSGTLLSLTVSDDGVGIAPAVLPHIFEPFVQDTRVLGLNGVGLGIGLTVAHSLVLAHGGDLVAHSDGANRGSRFVVTLPLLPAPAAQPTP